MKKSTAVFTLSCFSFYAPCEFLCEFFGKCRISAKCLNCKKVAKENKKDAKPIGFTS